MGNRKLKLLHIDDIEAKVLEAVYGENWEKDAAHNETALMHDILDKILELESQVRALRTAMRP